MIEPEDSQVARKRSTAVLLTVDRWSQVGGPPGYARSTARDRTKISQGRPNGRPLPLRTVDRYKPRRISEQPSVNGQPLMMERSTARLETVDRCGGRKLLKTAQRESSEA